MAPQKNAKGIAKANWIKKKFLLFRPTRAMKAVIKVARSAAASEMAW
jgi:hypothetical protein